MNNMRKGAIYVFLAGVFWSIAGVCVKYIPWNPLSIICARAIIATVVLAIYRKSIRVKLNFATVIGAAGFALTMVLFVFATKLTSAANAIVLQYSMPVFVIILNKVVLKQQPTRLQLITTVITLLGISLFFFDQFGSGSLLGNILAVLSGVSFAAAFFANQLKGADPEGASFLANALCILFFPAFFFEQGLATITPNVIFAIVLLGVVQQGLSYICFCRGIRHVTPFTAAISSSIEPILNPVLVFIILHEAPGIISIVGGVIVVGAIILYNLLLLSMGKKSMQAEAEAG